MEFKNEVPTQESENEIQSREDTEKQKMIEEAKKEREKLEQYGKIGQKVRIKNSVPDWNGLIGEIIAIETNCPFSDEVLDKWDKSEVTTLDEFPESKVKVYFTGGVNEKGERVGEEFKGSRTHGMSISKWEPVETE